MIPRLDHTQPASTSTRSFIDAVRAKGFAGDVRVDLATRIVNSTDNSIYQFLPEAVVAPRHHDDVVILLRALGEQQHQSVTLTARGGGTGTNGQSLTHGVVVDTSRHMNGILSIDVESRTARVQPGVVLDQLNDSVREHGLMFAPTVSTSSRATIGGMIANDSAGKGSRVYGKTSQHVRSLTTVFRTGESWTSRAMSEEELALVMQRDDVIGALHRVLAGIDEEYAEEIAAVFPPLNRFVTGYNLAMLRKNPDGAFNLNYVLCGSEGSLGIVTEAELVLTPMPRSRAVVLLEFASFDDALGSVEMVAPTEPSAIETMDGTLLGLVKDDEAYRAVSSYLEHEDAESVEAINLVEYVGDDCVSVEAQAEELVRRCDEASGESGGVLRATVLESDASVAAFWTLRSRSVGLLGRLPGARKPRAFVEDSVVPPEKLRDFVREFRALLDGHGLTYGMFGHVDVGVLHVRPALDLVDLNDVRLVRTLSDGVVALAQKYGGVLWGEHGKGVRGEFNEAFFGPVVTRLMNRVKGVVDPRGQLNPGKIAAPQDCDRVLLTIDETTRGSLDREVDPALRDRFSDAMDCNGNGQCFSARADVVMCPSWQETQDRVHSPKGRASLMREWLRRVSVEGGAESFLRRRRGIIGLKACRVFSRWRGVDDFSHEVHDAMQGCLACKACSGQCPVQVDVPDFRAEFLQAYFDRYPRRTRDYLVGHVESMLPWAARLPRVANGLTQSVVAQWCARHLVGLEDAPPVATPTLRSRLDRYAMETFDVGRLHSKSVVILQDAFTSFFAPEIVESCVRVGQTFGFDVCVAPYRPSGKSLHVKGFVRAFERRARRNAKWMRRVAETGATMVGLDPAVTLLYRDEYVRALGAGLPRVLMVQEWLAREVEAVCDRLPACSEMARVRWFGHCTERAMEPGAGDDWRSVFAAVGVDLELVSVGCCGMCGAYGHEREHVAQSRGIFDRSWRPALARGEGASAVATGYSCLSQVERMSSEKVEHPLVMLARLVGGGGSDEATERRSDEVGGGEATEWGVT